MGSLGYTVRTKWCSSSVLVRTARWLATSSEASFVYGPIVNARRGARTAINLMRFVGDSGKVASKGLSRKLRSGEHSSFEAAVFNIAVVPRSDSSGFRF